MRRKKITFIEIDSRNLSKMLSKVTLVDINTSTIPKMLFSTQNNCLQKNFSRYVTSPSPIHSERKNNTNYSCVGSLRDFSCVRKKRIFMNKSFPIDCVFSCCPTVLNVTFIFLKNSITPVSDNNSQSEKFLFSLVFSTLKDSQSFNFVLLTNVIVSLPKVDFSSKRRDLPKVQVNPSVTESQGKDVVVEILLGKGERHNQP